MSKLKSPPKAAEIFWVSSSKGGARQTFAWKWRAEGGERESSVAFDYFFECVEDATRRGYVVKLDGKPATTTARRIDIDTSRD